MVGTQSAVCLQFYLCAGQVCPKIRRLRVRAAIVRPVRIRNTVESPCGNLPLSLTCLLAFSFRLSPVAVPAAPSLSLVPREDGQADPSVRTATPHCSRMVQLAPILSRVDADTYSRTRNALCSPGVCASRLTMTRWRRIV